MRLASHVMLLIFTAPTPRRLRCVTDVQTLCTRLTDNLYSKSSESAKEGERKVYFQARESQQASTLTRKLACNNVV